MSLHDWLVSWLRTNVAAWIPSVAAWLASYGIDLPVEPTSVVLVSLAVSGYYTLARILESVWPAAGVLLGYKAAPTYVASAHPGAHTGRNVTDL